MATNEELIIRVRADTERANRQIEALNRQIRDLRQQVRDGNTPLAEQSNRFNAINSSASELKSTIIGLVGAYAGFSVIKDTIATGAEFEASIDKLGAVSQATQLQLEALEAKALELGASTKYSSSQVAEGMNYLAMAGISANDNLASIEATLNLASVGSLDLAEASDIASNAMSGFGLKADDMSRISDVMSATITNSNTNVQQLGEAFKNVASIATSANVSIEETSAILGVLGDAGRQGGDAGTHLKIILQRLATQAKPTADALNEIGVEVFDSNGKFRDMITVIKEVAEKTKGLNDQDKSKVLKGIAGEEAIASMQVILNGLDSYDEKLVKIEGSAGLAGKVAQEMTDNLKGEWDTLLASIESLQTAIFEDLKPSLSGLVADITDIVRSSKDFYNANSEVIASVLSVAKTLGVLVAGFYALNTAVKAFQVASLLLVANPIGAFFTGIGVAITGAVVAIEYFNGVSEQAKNVNEDLTKSFDKSNEVLGKYKDNFTIEELEAYIAETELLIESKKKLAEEFKNKDTEKFADEIKSLENEVKSLDGFMIDLKGNLNQLNEAEKKQAEELKKVEEATKDLSKQTQNLTADELKLLQAIEDNSSKAFSTVKRDYDNRLNKGISTLNKLKDQESSLASDIEKIQADLVNKLQSIDNSRVQSQSALESKIRDIKRGNLSEIQAFKDKELQAEQTLADAKNQLAKGNLDLYKSYMSEYEGLVSSLANTEITQDEKIILSKQQSNQIAINGLNEIKNLEDTYYSQVRQKEIDLSNEKLSSKKLELEAVRVQIIAQNELTTAIAKMVEMLTGNKLDINTDESKQAILNLSNNINEIDKQMKNNSLQIDNSQALTSISTVKNDLRGVESTKASITIENTTPQVLDDLNRKIEDLVTYRKIALSATFIGQSEIDRIESEIAELEKQREIQLGNSQALTSIDTVKSDLNGVESTIDFNLTTANAIIEIDNVQTKISTIESEVRLDLASDEAKSEIDEIDNKIKSIEKLIELSIKKGTAEADVSSLQNKIDDLEKQKELILKTDTASTSISEINSKIDETQNERYLTYDTLKATDDVLQLNDILDRLENEKQIKINANAPKEEIAEIEKDIEGFEETRDIIIETKLSEDKLDGINLAIEEIEKEKQLTLDGKSAKFTIDELDERLALLEKIKKIYLDNKDSVKSVKEVKELIKDLEKKTKNVHVVLPDSKDAEQAISNLEKDTHSTHTIYVKEVKTKALGGLIETHKTGGVAGSQFKRKNGKIAGHDLNGTDDVPAMLTRGEFVQNTRAVDFYGADFMNSLNSLSIPKSAVQNYATGGLVLNKDDQILIESFKNNRTSTSESNNSENYKPVKTNNTTNNNTTNNNQKDPVPPPPPPPYIGQKVLEDYQGAKYISAPVVYAIVKNVKEAKLSANDGNKLHDTIATTLNIEPKAILRDSLVQVSTSNAENKTDALNEITEHKKVITSSIDEDTKSTEDLNKSNQDELDSAIENMKSTFKSNAESFNSNLEYPTKDDFDVAFSEYTREKDKILKDTDADISDNIMPSIKDRNDEHKSSELSKIDELENTTSSIQGDYDTEVSTLFSEYNPLKTNKDTIKTAYDTALATTLNDFTIDDLTADTALATTAINGVKTKLSADFKEEIDNIELDLSSQKTTKEAGGTTTVNSATADKSATITANATDKTTFTGLDNIEATDVADYLTKVQSTNAELDTQSTTFTNNKTTFLADVVTMNNDIIKDVNDLKIKARDDKETKKEEVKTEVSTKLDADTDKSEVLPEEFKTKFENIEKDVEAIKITEDSDFKQIQTQIDKKEETKTTTNTELDTYLKNVTNKQSDIDSKFTTLNNYGLEKPQDVSDSVELKKLIAYENRVNGLKMQIEAYAKANKSYKVMEDVETKVKSLIQPNALDTKYETKTVKQLVTKERTDEELTELIKEKYKLPAFRVGGSIDLTQGGKLQGYGGGDRNLALVEDGEFVVRKERAIQNRGLLESINNGNFKGLDLPKFEFGGMVGINNPTSNIQNISSDISSSSQNLGTYNLNLKMPDGGKLEAQMTPEQIAKGLDKYIKLYGV